MATDAPPDVTRAQRAQRLHGIYVIVNESPHAFALAQAALDAGVRILQYRAKKGADELHVAALRTITRQRNALLILNDDWRAAAACGCDGVHLGPGDDGFDDPRALRAAAPDLLVGLSCGTALEIDAATRWGADYVGVGCIFPTRSKHDAGAPIGIDGLRNLSARTALPVAAIGGIDATNVIEVRDCGVAMAAVIGAVAGAPDPARAAEELVTLWGVAS